MNKCPQLNPCDDQFWKSRGYPERPRNWQQLLEDMEYYDESDQNSSHTEYSSDDDTESDSDEERQNRTESNPQQRLAPGNRRQRNR